MQQTVKGGLGSHPVKMKKRSFPIGTILMYTVLFGWSLTTIYALFWIVNNSFKVSRDVMNNSFKIALDPVMVNYTNAFDRISIGKGYLNSLIMSGSTVLLVLLFGGLAAYVLSRFQFRGRKLIYSILYASLLIPAFATVVPVYELLIKWNLANTYGGLIFPQTAGNLTFAILVLAGYLSTIPKELEEAAFIDGAGHLSTLVRIIVPLSVPALATIMLFTVVGHWNAWFDGLILMNSPAHYPLQSYLQTVVIQKDFTALGEEELKSLKVISDRTIKAAEIILGALPVLVVYPFLQKYFMKGIVLGSVKE
jgi:raffinose/stachyose/melibiose transport system permease protein